MSDGCPTGKAKLTAQLAKERAKKSSGRYSQAMTPYRCKECGGWHIGQPTKKRAPIPFKRRH